MFISISKAARIMGVSATTMRRWDKEKKLLPTFRTRGGHKQYKITTLLKETKQTTKKRNNRQTNDDNRLPVVIYSRVSSSKQRKDLQRQEEHLESFVEKQHWQLVKKYQDIGSRLNDQRKGLLKMIRELPVIQPAKIVCSYPDRLARFGLQLIATIGSLFGTEIVITHQQRSQKKLNEQLVEDVLAVITSFAGKRHRSRRGKQKT